MGLVSILSLLLLSTAFESTIDRAFTLLRNNQWAGGASALDQAYIEDPGLFSANNFHYLRGRVAENQRDWQGALEEFKKIGPGNPLHILAVWHAARASAQLHDDVAAEVFLSDLPRDFPGDLKLQIARESSEALALKIYQDVPTREARLARAKLLGDHDALWSLLRERKDDDVALECVRLVAASASAPQDQMAVGEVYATHRQFDDAIRVFQSAAESPSYAAAARYQIARAHFQRGNHRLAMDVFQSIASDFPGTHWEKDSEYQIAACYWRLGEYRNSEKAYVSYIDKYASNDEDDAVRNLIDVYRVLDENQKALSSLDRTLAKRLSTTNRQVLLFTKAKILYTQKRYTAALRIFEYLGRIRLRPAPGGTTPEEVQYFQALCLSKSGNKPRAEPIWRRLARERFSYYGQRAAEKLGARVVRDQQRDCTALHDTTSQNIEAGLAKLRHAFRSQTDSKADALSELIFLGLWDEASLWVDRPGYRRDARLAAQISFLAGRYYRSVMYAQQLPKGESGTLALLYPVGFRQAVCEAAGMFKVDPLWLHAIIWQESKYNPNARSGASARGLMQLIPETAKAVASEIGMPELTLDRLYDPAVNIRTGAQYWSSLLEKLKSPEMALAAYNGGLDNVQRWKNKWPGAGDDTDLFVADIGFVETKAYVMAVFAAHAAYATLQ